MKRQKAAEDVLKHLAEREGEGRATSPADLAQVPGLTDPQEAAQALEDLRVQGLVTREGDTLALTPAGRASALSLLRAHRIYETFLAHRTGVRPADWHGRADAEEHRLSRIEVEALAAQLGNPPYDPHGDPIPTAAGVVPPRTGRPLPACAAGWAGRVVHVEDEPETLYRPLLAAGLAPDVRVRVEAAGPDGVRLRAEGRAFRFTAAEAAQVTVADLPPGETFDDAQIRLADLRPGERAVVTGLSPLLRGLARSRMLDLGVVPGSVLEIGLVSPGGDPIAYRIRGALIALRREQAERVLVRRAGGPP